MTHETQALLPLIDLLLTDQRLDRSEFIREVFVRYRTVARFSSAVFLPVDPNSWEMKPGVCFECDDAQMAEYLDYYAPFDPMVRNGPTPATVNQAFSFSEVAAGVSGWEREFAEFRDRVPYRYSLAALVATPAGPLGALAIHRTWNRQDFDDEDKRLLSRIVTYLAKGELWRQRSESNASRPTATLLVAETGQVLWMNEPARFLLAAMRIDPLSLYRLSTPSLRLDTPCGAFLARVEPLKRNSLYVRWASTTRSSMIVQSMATAPRERTTELLAGVRIVNISPIYAPIDTCAAFADLGLTAAESRVAGGIVRGLALKTIARDLGIEQDTVKKHAVHIYHKAQVRNRADLAAWLAGLKGIAPAGRAPILATAL